MINRLRMRHVRCFLAVARAESMTAASKTLNSSQPALSRSIAELESIIGQPLFSRTGRGLVLTDSGQKLYRYLDIAMSQIETGARSAGGAAPRPRVSVGILPNVARTLAVDAAATYKASEPAVDLALHWSSVPELFARLHRNEIDFLLGRLMPLEHMAGVSFEHLYTEPIIFVVRPDHVFGCEPDAVDLSDLCRELIVIPMTDTIIRLELDKFTTARGLDGFPNVIETVSFEFVRAFLSKHRAVACVPLGAVRQEIEAGSLVRLGLHGEELVSSVGITYLAGRRLSEEADLLAEHVRAAAAKFQ